MSFFKPEVSFSSNFASLFSVMKYSSSVLLYLKHYIRWSGGAHLKCKFWRLSSTRVKIRQIPHSVLKWQVNSSSIFTLFIVMTHNSSVSFKFTHSLLWTKGSHQSPNFDTFEWSGENLLNSWCNFPNNKSVFLQILHHSLVLWKITPLYFLGQTLNTSHNRNQSKWKFF